MRTYKIGFLLLMAVCLSFGCTHYPSGFFVKTDSISPSAQADIWTCHVESEKNANLTIHKVLPTSMGYYPVRAEDAVGAAIVLTAVLPIEMERRQRWVNLYFNTMKACMEGRGYSWISGRTDKE